MIAMENQPLGNTPSRADPVASNTTFIYWKSWAIWATRRQGLTPLPPDFTRNFLAMT